jgi:hypothetical protein
MKPIKENIGLYAILIILIYWIVSFLSQFTHSPGNRALRIEFIFGPFATLFFILMLVAVVSIFWDYKFNWIVISIPFLWKLLLPFKIASFGVFKGTLINLFASLFQANITGVWVALSNSIIPLLVVVYLFLKNTRNLKF